MSRLDDLMQTKMTRRRFLRTLGVGLGVLIGLPAIMRVLDYQGSGSNNQPVSSDLYGYSPYGGSAGSRTPKHFG